MGEISRTVVGASGANLPEMSPGSGSPSLGPTIRGSEITMEWHHRTDPESRREVSAEGSSSAMTTNRQMARGSAWRIAGPRNWARPPGLALLGLALIGLIQAGCRSDGCSDCNLGSKLTNGVQALTARVTKHFSGCQGGGDCGCGSGGETFVDSGTPVISGGMVIPAPGTIVPAPSMEQPPTQLDPIVPNGQPTSGSTRSTPSGANRSSYTTMAPKGTTAQRRGSDVSRALHSSPEGTNSSDPLDNLPPVDLPSEVTKSAIPAAKPNASPTPAPVPAAAACRTGRAGRRSVNQQPDADPGFVHTSPRRESLGGGRGDGSRVADRKIKPVLCSRDSPLRPRSHRGSRGARLPRSEDSTG